MYQIIFNGLLEGSSIAVLAVAFGIYYKTTKVFHFAFGAIYVFSVYMFYLTNSFILAVFLALLLSLLIEYLIYFPLSRKNASLSTTLISSIGVYIILVNIISLLFGNEAKILTDSAHQSIEIFGLFMTKSQILLFAVPLLFTLAILIFMQKTNLGKLLVSAGDNLQLSRVMGLKVKYFRVLAILISTLLASIVAIFKGFDVSIDPFIGMSAVLTAAVAFIISGGEKYYSMIITGFLIGMIRNVSTWYVSSQWTEAITFIMLVTFLIYKNKGVISKQIRLEER